MGFFSGLYFIEIVKAATVERPDWNVEGLVLLVRNRIGPASSGLNKWAVAQV
jgi:hypothetical protein